MKKGDDVSEAASVSVLGKRKTLYAAVR